MNKGKAFNKTKLLLIALRILAILTAACLLLPALNPANISSLSNGRLPLFTSGFIYSKAEETFIRALGNGWVEQGVFNFWFFTSMFACIGNIISILGGCLTLGEVRLRKLGSSVIFIGSLLSIMGLLGLLITYNRLLGSGAPDRVNPHIGAGFIISSAVAVLSAVLSLFALFILEKPTKQDRYKMKPKYYLFLLLLPFILLTFVFSYFPLWSWIYGFFDFRPGLRLGSDNFVGFKWFKYLFQAPPIKENSMFGYNMYKTTTVTVLKNTFAMSGLSLAVSWLAMVFAVFITEIKSKKLRGIFLAISAIPNFISWVVVYVAADACSGLIARLFNFEEYPYYLSVNSHIWLRMAAFSTWKGLGWGAVIYLAAIMSIDKELYDAAKADGAGRLGRILHITIPQLLPTYFVLLLLSIAGIFSTGMDQSFIFSNHMNLEKILVPDQYAFRLRFNDFNSIPLTSVVSMTKSFLSILFLILVSRLSKLFMKESIV